MERVDEKVLLKEKRFSGKALKQCKTQSLKMENVL